jgi:hypothetical protein
MYSPQWLFLYPGLLLVVLGGLTSMALFFKRVDIGIRFFDFHSFILTGALLLVGVNMISFAGITRVFAYNFDLLPARPRFFDLLKYFTLETGLAIGFLLSLAGVFLILYAANLSVSPGFETLGFDKSVRLVFGGSLLTVTGTQIIFTSFVLSMLGLNPKE